MTTALTYPACAKTGMPGRNTKSAASHVTRTNGMMTFALLLAMDLDESTADGLRRALPRPPSGCGRFPARSAFDGHPVRLVSCFSMSVELCTLRSSVLNFLLDLSTNLVAE